MDLYLHRPRRSRARFTWTFYLSLAKLSASPAGLSRSLPESRRSAQRPARLADTPAAQVGCCVFALWQHVEQPDHDLLELNLYNSWITSSNSSRNRLAAPRDTHSEVH